MALLRAQCRESESWPQACAYSLPKATLASSAAKFRLGSVQQSQCCRWVWKATLPMAMDSSLGTLGILDKKCSRKGLKKILFIFRKIKWQPSSRQLLWARKGVDLHWINYLPVEISSPFVSLIFLVLLSPQSPQRWNRTGRDFGVTLPLCQPKQQKRD